MRSTNADIVFTTIDKWADSDEGPSFDYSMPTIVSMAPERETGVS